MITPKEIKLKKGELIVTWENGTVHTYPLIFLRDQSPDAGNKGETILWKHYDPAPQGPDKPGKYEIASIEQVGSYAVSITWKDGYNYGIYSYDLLWRWGEYLEVKRNLHQDIDDENENHNREK